MHLRMLQKIPIKSFSNKFFQPWISEVAVLKTQNLFLFGSLHREFEDVKLRVFEAAKRWLTCQVRDLVWLHPRHPPAAGLGVALRNPGASFPVLCFPNEEWLLFSCLHYFLGKMFCFVFRSLKDAGVQRRFPLVRNDLSQSPFLNPALFQVLAVARISCLLIASITLEHFIV